MRSLLVKMFKVVHSLTDNEIIRYMNNSTTNYNLCWQGLSVVSVNSTYKGLNSRTYYGAVTWKKYQVVTIN